MAYLDNTEITVDAILTKKGRELLAQGRDKFQITQFALADDEVDYNLWNPAHSLGSDYYGAIIENMPVLEALSDENYTMKYKLLTLPKSTVKLPIIVPSVATLSLEESGVTSTINITTKNGGNSLLGYTAVLLNSDAANIVGNPGVPGGTSPSTNTTSYISNKSVTVVGKDAFTITTKVLPSATAITTRIIFIGNETGGRTEVTLTVNPFTGRILSTRTVAGL
jgi:hypothetical protein